MSPSQAHGPSAGPAEANGLRQAHGPRGHCTPLPPPLGGPDHDYLTMSKFYRVLHIEIDVVFNRNNVSANQVKVG